MSLASQSEGGSCLLFVFSGRVWTSLETFIPRLSESGIVFVGGF